VLSNKNKMGTSDLLSRLSHLPFLKELDDTDPDYVELARINYTDVPFIGRRKIRQDEVHVKGLANIDEEQVLIGYTTRDDNPYTRESKVKLVWIQTPLIHQYTFLGTKAEIDEKVRQANTLE
jgi:hypothetical protein